MERTIASLANLQSAGRMVRTAWLADLTDCQDLIAFLGGDACIHGYTLAEWDSFQHVQKNDEGLLETLQSQTSIHQFCVVTRAGEQPGAPPIFPYGPDAFSWIQSNFPPWVVRRIVRISDELSGWKTLWDPFGKLRKGNGKPDSGGGASGDSDAPSEN